MGRFAALALLVASAAFGQESPQVPTLDFGVDGLLFGAGGADALVKVLDPLGAGYDSTNGDLYTTRGGAVTFARTSTWVCPDSNGTIRALAANKPCVVDGQSLKVRSAVTNSILQSEDLATTWTSTGTPTLSTNTWDFGVGSATGETLGDDDAAADEGKGQTVTTGVTGSWTFACYLQSGTLSTVRLKVLVNGGTGTTTCSLSGLTGTTSRQLCTATAGAGVTSVRGEIFPGVNTASTGDVKVGGCQLRQSDQPGDYCSTLGTASTCTAETATVPTPAALSLTEGCFCASFTPTWTGNTPSSFVIADAVAATSETFISSAVGFNTIFSHDGTTSTAVSAGFTLGVRKRYCNRWSAGGNFNRIENVTDGVSNTAAFTTRNASNATIGLACTSTGASQANGSIDSIVFGRSATGCN